MKIFLPEFDTSSVFKLVVPEPHPIRYDPVITIIHALLAQPWLAPTQPNQVTPSHYPVSHTPPLLQWSTSFFSSHLFFHFHFRFLISPDNPDPLSLLPISFIFSFSYFPHFFPFAISLLINIFLLKLSLLKMCMQ